MKKMIMLFVVLAAFTFGQSLVFSNQTITVEPSQLSVESVSFKSLEIATNSVATWVTATNVVELGLLEGGGFLTNVVRQQVVIPVVATNAASWTCNVVFDLPRGHRWSLNGMPVTIERFRARLEVPVDPAMVQATFGAAAAGLEFAASNGAYQPTGQVKDAFLGLAAAALAGGAEQ